MALILVGIFALGSRVVASEQPYPEDKTASSQVQIQTLFNDLEIAGNAYNGGGGNAALDSVLSLGCSRSMSLLQEQLNGGMGDVLNLLPDAVGSLGLHMGQQGVSGLMSAGCSALVGEQGTGTEGLASSMKDQLALGLLGAGLGWANSSGLPFLSRLELETGTERDKWVTSITTIQPLWQDLTAHHHIFTQLAWRQVDGEKTVNAGIAYRVLNEDKDILYGINTFFDHAFEMNHNRMSIGADIQSSLLGGSINRYFPLSDWKSRDEFWEEKAAGGFDAEIHGQFPQLPSWTGSFKAYQWDGSDNQYEDPDREIENTYGYLASLEYAPVPAFAIRGGMRNENTDDTSLEFALRFNLKFNEPLDLQFKPKLELASVEDRVYAKVSRENTIRIQERRKSSTTLTTVETVGANTATGQPGTVGLLVGQTLLMPSVVTVANTVGAVARLKFSDGAILTLGQNTSVRVEPTQITLISGVAQYTSGSTVRVINVPGAVIELLGTDIDVSSSGGTSSNIRVRDGAIRITGTSGGSAQISAGDMGQSINGVVGTVAVGSPDYEAHTDEVSAKLDRVANPQNGGKVAPYPIDPPRVITSATAIGQPITLGLRFNTAVTVAGGTPRLHFTINGNARMAALTSGTGTTELVFTYTLLPADAGATSLTVEEFDLNGASVMGEGKNAVTTIADTVLSLSGSVVDVTPPSGYAVAFTTDPVTDLNDTAVEFEITGAEVGTTFDYTISSSGGGTDVTGTGTIATATQAVTAVNVSGLGLGTLTLSLTLTDAASNVGAAVTDTVNKETAATLVMNFATNRYRLNGNTYSNVSSFITAAGASFSRATIGTYYDASGVLRTSAAGQLRLDHDPLTGTPRGLLIEEQRQNRLVASSQMDNVNWQKPNVVVAVDQAVAPDGTMTADKVAINTGTGLSNIFQDSLVTSGSIYTQSVFVKAAGLNYVQIGSSTGFNSTTSWANFNLTNGTIGNQGSVGTPRIEDVGNGWYRLAFTATSNSTISGRFYIAPIPTDVNTRNGPQTGDGVAGVYMWGAQFEAGSAHSSYIPTTNGMVTRNRDYFVLPSAAWYNAPAGTVRVTSQHGVWGAASSLAGIFSIDNSADVSGINERISLLRLSATSNEGLVAITSGGSQFYSNMVGAGDYGVNTNAMSYQLNYFRRAQNGVWSGADSSGTPPTVNQLRLGVHGTTRMYNGWIKDFTYYPVRVLDNTLRAMTQ